MIRLEADAYSVKEVTVDIRADQLVQQAAGHDILVLRVTGLTASGGSGRPVTRSIRIPVQMLNDAAAAWDR